MEVESSQYRHCDLVKVSGRIDSSTAPQLANALDDITGSGRFKIVLDLDEVDFMSSAGLRVLISTQKNNKRYNRGELILARVPKRIYDALELAGFVPLFTFKEDLISAIGSF